MDRRSHTTQAIRNAALAEFAEVGSRALNFRRVAARAYVSVGAVYDRWPNKDACVADLVTSELPNTTALLQDLWRDGSQQLDMIVYRNLLDSVIVTHLRFMAECVFAARDRHELQPQVREAVRALEGTIRTRTHRPASMSEFGWWVVSAWLGYALLKPAGCPIPDSFVRATAVLINELGHVVAEPEVVAALTSKSIEFLPERAIVQDPTTKALVLAAQQLIDERGGDALDLRSIAETAGVSTGALYRRFTGRSELLATAFIANLPAERYAWTRPLLSTLQARGMRGGAALLAALCERIWTDKENANSLLEFSVAAHTDAGLLDVISAEIERVADQRTLLFAELIDAGIVRKDLTAEAIAWQFQVPPVGMRLLASIDIVPDTQDLTTLLEAYLNFLMAPQRQVD